MEEMLIILDGAADLKCEELNWKTPLESAKTPNIDFFSKNSRLGFMYPINEGIVPSSDNSVISIFGNDDSLSRRGIFEAVGCGIKLKRGDLVLRTNFGTIEDLKTKVVIDRRAGRTLTDKEARILSETLNKKIKLQCKFELRPTIQHRGVVVFRGGFSDNISNIDNDYSKNNPSNKFSFSEPLDDDELSKYSANILNSFVEQAFKILKDHRINLKRVKKGLLPANMVFARGPGIEIPKLRNFKNWMSINYMPLEIGIAKLSGMDNFSFSYPTNRNYDVYENLYDGLNKAIDFAILGIKKRYRNYRGCYIQFKETDVPGHDNRPFDKKRMIEILDNKFFSFLRSFIEKKNIKVVLTCDHSTPCKLKNHSSHPVPVLFYDKKLKDKNLRFCEEDSKKGSLGKIYGRELLKKVGFF